MTIQGQEQIVKGTVLFFLADTPAAHSIGGFKSGVGLALRKCRHCLATQENIAKKVSGRWYLLEHTVCIIANY